MMTFTRNAKTGQPYLRRHKSKPCLHPEREADCLGRDTRDLSGEMEMFSTVKRVWGKWIYTFVKITQLR